MNSCDFIGRLTATPELKATPNGKSVCNFSLAVERQFKDADGNTIVDYPDFVAWGSQAEFLCKWFDKGVRVAITSKVQTRTYADNDGKNRKVVEFRVETVEFADGKREATTTNTFPTTNANPAATTSNTNTFGADGFSPVDSGEKLPWDN